MATQLGTSLDIGAGTITGSYIVESRDEDEYDTDFEDIFDEDGVLETRIIFFRHLMTTLNLICVTGALPETDFPSGLIATHADFTSDFVESATMTRSKSARRVTVALKTLGIT